MWKKFLSIFAPFSLMANGLDTIATELIHLRKLYELELQERDPPIMLRPDTPQPDDTEVLYDEDKPKKPRSALAKLLAKDEDDEDQEPRDA